MGWIHDRGWGLGGEGGICRGIVQGIYEVKLPVRKSRISLNGRQVAHHLIFGTILKKSISWCMYVHVHVPIIYVCMYEMKVGAKPHTNM